MQKKSLLIVLASYVLWGLLPLYWALLSGLNAMFILANRILWSAVFTVVLLFILKRRHEILATLRNRQVMKYLIPAALLVTVNWGLYIWAVNEGRVLDASLGYYMNPLMVFACGMLFFKERCGKLELLALLLAAAGVVISTLRVGTFPFVAVILAVTFSAYGTMKKLAHIDGLVSVCVETLLLMPFALLFLIFAPQSAAAFAVITPWQLALCIGAGIVTALPLILYSQGVNQLSLITMGFLQYICPTLMFLISVLNGEDALGQLPGFAFIWAGLILFTIGLIRRERRNVPAVQDVKDSPKPSA